MVSSPQENGASNSYTGVLPGGCRLLQGHLVNDYALLDLNLLCLDAVVKVCHPHRGSVHALSHQFLTGSRVMVCHADSVHKVDSCNHLEVVACMETAVDLNAGCTR